MIRLDTVNRSLRIVLAGAVTTNQLHVTVGYSDKTSTSYAGATYLSVTNNTTPVTICPAPAASTIRDIDYVNVYNSDTAAATVVISLLDTATSYSQRDIILQVDDTLTYTHASGWIVTSQSGSSIQVTSIFGRTGAVTAQVGDYATFYVALVGLSTQTFSVATATSAAHAVRLDQLPVPYRNRLINSDHSVNQVYNPAHGASGTAVTPTASQFVIDQWYASISQASKLTFQQVSDAPDGLKYSTKITVASQFNPGAADYFVYRQRIIGENIIDFKLGTAGAVTILTSNYIKGSVAGNYAVSLRNGANNRSYVGIVAVTTAWQRLTISLVGDVSGTWLTDTGAGLELALDLGSGSNFNTTADAWQAGNYTRTSGATTFVNQVNGSTLNIAGCQIEKGITGQTAATDFEVLSYAEQLDRAQYYRPAFTGFATTNFLSTGGYTSTTSDGVAHFAFKKPTRVPVTGVGYSTLANFDFATPTVSSVVTAITFSSASTHLVGVTGVAGTGTPYTASQPASLLGDANEVIYFTGAEL